MLEGGRSARASRARPSESCHYAAARATWQVLRNVFVNVCRAEELTLAPELERAEADCKIINVEWRMWNLGTPEFIYEFMKHMNSYMKKSYEFIVYMNSYMNSYV